MLISDSGSTKTDWTLVDKDTIITQVTTQGINPFFQSQDEIATDLSHNLIPNLPTTEFDGVYFYGAGCAFDDKIKLVTDALATHFKASKICVNSDMLGAAHALCGYQPGIACILGTGSNSCEYDGKKIVSNVSPLGFILGDEGSGAVIGKLFIGSLLKNQLSAGLKEKFLDEYELTVPEIIHRVYKEPFPNRFLATMAPFINSHISDKSIYKLLLESFKDFFRRNVMQYNYKEMEVHFIGSIAYHFSKVIKEAANDLGVTVGTIVKSPMKGLINYHLRKEQ